MITFVDVTSIVRAEEHQRLLVDELNHRVKNMLTVVISLATNTIRRSETLEAFTGAFLGRIHALSAPYALLSRDAWSPIPLREILLEELRPFMSRKHMNAGLSGPAVLLEPRVALALGVAVHELTTNAIKVGALSSQRGEVDISWTVSQNDNRRVLDLKWIEQNGPPVTLPDHRGFGMTLIERAFAHDVGGEARIDFPPQGLIATLHVPLSIVQPKGTL